ncbi:hypothetical protein ABT369_49255 [Dactylosporangium sp. NPDC000244]|uniref:hypothetical protein n=1 Tax=Dactylosporangium sp. NPDC000244 TaxID=3154365 RepID=UPI00331E2A11
MSLWEQAAQCYRDAGAHAEAARCYGRAGLFRQAADLYLEIGDPASAVPMFERATEQHQAGWLLVHVLDRPADARACLARHTPPPAPAPPAVWSAPILLRQLVEARCDIAERARDTAALATLLNVQEALAGPDPVSDVRVTEWATSVAKGMGRMDQAALVHAAAVRGRRPGARQRFITWAAAEFGTPIVLPPDPEPAVAGRAA